MAQNQMVCQFCETSTIIKWKCVHCDATLCEDCKTKIHNKIRNFKEHDVIAIKELNTTTANETIRTLDLKNIQCTKLNHGNEKCIIYCQDCNKLLCSLCLIESHANHKFGKITHVYREKLQELKDLEGKSNQHIHFFSETEKEQEAIISKGLTHYNEIKQKILQREAEIKDAATRQSENLVSEMDKLWKPQKYAITETLSEIGKKTEDLCQRVSDIEKTFLSQKAMSIFTASDTIRKDLPAISAKIEPSMKQFILLQSRPVETSICLGSLRTIPELKVTQSYHSDLGNIFKINTTDDGINILCCYIDKIICKFELANSKCLTTKLTGSVDVIDMTLTKQGKLLFSLCENSEVTSIGNLSSKSTMETLTSISPLYVRGIHATDRNILIRFCDNSELFPLTKDSRRGIIIQDYNCRHIRTLECDTNNDRIFSLPDVITTNINADICVIDSEEYEWVGRVVVLTELGSVKWTYKGHSTVNTIHKFSPYGLVTTNEGFVLVADRKSNAIHMLSIDGELLTHLTDKNGIEQPLCLNIDKSGKLLIGCTSTNTHDEIAKLHVVEITV